MKKGVAIAVGSVAALVMGAIGIFIYAVVSYEKDHPEMAQASKALLAVELEVMSFKGEKGLGNSDEAKALANHYSTAMKAARQVLFSGTDQSKTSFTRGEFVTHCTMLPDKCAFIVHVPQLRNYTSEAETAMAEMGWRMAVLMLRDRPTLPKELAVGICGPMNYGRIIVGAPSAKGDPMAGIRERSDQRDILFPFFTVLPFPDRENRQTK